MTMNPIETIEARPRFESILTYTGQYFHLPNFEDGTDGPRPFDIRDIAHHLSNMCRYSGACNRFYSVAEHSVYVSLLVPEKDAKAGLLHDLAEAYIVDIPRPFKHLLKNYKELDHIVTTEGLAHFGVEYPYGEAVKVADNAMLFEVEQPRLFDTLFPTPKLSESDIRHVGIWHEAKIRKDIRPKCLDPISAEKLFLERYHELFYPNTSHVWRNTNSRTTDHLVQIGE